MNKFAFSFICIFLAFISGNSQKLDSLEKIYHSNQSIQKIKLYNELYPIYLKNNPIKALKISIETLDLSNDLSNDSAKCASLNNIGNIYNNNGFHKRALVYLKEAVRLNQKDKNKELHASILSNIGFAYANMKIHENAISYYDRAYKILKESKKKETLINILINIGDVYIELNDMEKALQFYNNALLNYESDISSSLKFKIFRKIGEVYEIQQELETTLSYYNKSIEANKNDTYNKAIDLNKIGAVYIKMKMNRKAITTLNLAKKYAVSTHSNLLLISQIYKNLSIANKNLNNYKTAYEYETFYSKSIEIFNIKNIENVKKQMNLGLELHNNEKEIHIKKMDEQIKELKISNNRNLYIIGIMGSLLLIGSAVICLKLVSK